MRISDWSSDVCSSDLTWDITAETDAGTLCLGAGGARLTIDGTGQDVGPEREYPEIYARFARPIREDRSDVDRTLLRLVADAFMRCRRLGAAPFEDGQASSCMMDYDIQKGLGYVI